MRQGSISGISDTRADHDIPTTPPAIGNLYLPSTTLTVISQIGWVIDFYNLSSNFFYRDGIHCSRGFPRLC